MAAPSSALVNKLNISGNKLSFANQMEEDFLITFGLIYNNYPVIIETAVPSATSANYTASTWISGWIVE